MIMQLESSSLMSNFENINPTKKLFKKKKSYFLNFLQKNTLNQLNS